MKRQLPFIIVLLSLTAWAQNPAEVPGASSNWSHLIKLDNFDPNDDQQSNADTDFVGNANFALMDTQKDTISFNDGIEDDVYYFRVRMGQSNASTSFYFGIDVTGDLIGDLFVEANMKSQIPYVSFHPRDYSKSGISPSQTSWLNGERNNELILDTRNAFITSYSAGTDIDGGNSGTDFWIEFAFTEDIFKEYVLNNFGISVDGNSIIAMYVFTSTSQTSNGDVGGVNDSIPGELDKSWVELGAVLQGTLNGLSSGIIVTPTVDNLITDNLNPILTGTWGGSMLGDDSLAITVNDITYTEDNGLVIDGLNWSLTLFDANLSYGTYDVIASVNRSSNDETVIDETTSELFIFPPSESESSVTSGNDGGLESNGDLANLIAMRNFNRSKKGSKNNKKEAQRVYKKSEIPLSYNKTSNGAKSSNETSSKLEGFLPTSGFTGEEVAYVSSPNDLLGITNAQHIVAVDYYINDKRVAAIYATETTGKIYDHSKIICDRLNSSILEDASSFMIDGHQVISTKIKRSTGEIEYTLTFSIKKGDSSNQLFSLWNIESYPTGDYYNFQIWGGSYMQILSLGSSLIQNIKNDKVIISDKENNVIPSVFVKSGYYSKGIIYLNILNKGQVKSIEFEGNIKVTEISSRTSIKETIELSGDVNEMISIETGNLFDVGLSLSNLENNLKDILYLADGPWGIDYPEDYAFVDTYDVTSDDIIEMENTHLVERNARVEGQVKGNVNLFRHLLPGDQTLNVEEFNSIKFQLSSSMPVEVVLMQEGLADWNNRFRYTINEGFNYSEQTLLFKDFKDANGNSAQGIKDIKTIVFSVIGDYTNFVDFQLSVSNVAFLNNQSLEVDENSMASKQLTNYPNPFSTETTIKIPVNASQAELIVYDMMGRMVDKRNLPIENMKALYSSNKLKVGIYKYVLNPQQFNKSFVGTFIIK